ncbi:MAG TPA: indole-3-glycerol phosphate synthase TrpC [Chloroflexota bacterium]|nr:indole-3-glycerol phosphate synthase TrpC [Chloroflexota bacterium]
MSILDEILAHKRGEVAAAQAAVPLARLLDEAQAQPPARGFAAALRGPADASAPRLIAEIKKVSPAKGALNPDLDVRAMATVYERGGAAAISVLTAEKFFSGHLDDLRAVRGAVGLPVLRKDFVVDAYQLAEARAAGADAALLIVAAFDQPLPAIAGLLKAARELGLDCLVEVHDEAELTLALDAGAGVIGINNRNLKTFEVSLGVTERLAPRVPADKVLVSESGITSAEDARRVRRAGASAVLVGSALVSAGDPAQKVRELVAA